MILFIISFFSTSPLHVKRRLPYIIKGNSSEGFQNHLMNEGLILDQWKIKKINTYYLDVWTRRCSIVICIVM